MAAGGRKAPDYKARPPAGPGAFSRRSDMNSQQPVRAPTGMEYGDHSALLAQQQAAPVPEGGALGEQAPQAPQTSDLSGLLSTLPTQRPNEPMSSAPPTGGASAGLAFKIDVLRHLATLPYASPEITKLLEDAVTEMHATQQPAPPSALQAPAPPSSPAPQSPLPAQQPAQAPTPEPVQVAPAEPASTTPAPI